ncbi:hypothetical protein MUNTM_05600 [Mycobacterium sp. MUNTM1]
METGSKSFLTQTVRPRVRTAVAVAPQRVPDLVAGRRMVPDLVAGRRMVPDLVAGRRMVPDLGVAVRRGQVRAVVGDLHLPPRRRRPPRLDPGHPQSPRRRSPA